MQALHMWACSSALCLICHHSCILAILGIASCTRDGPRTVVVVFTQASFVSDCCMKIGLCEIASEFNGYVLNDLEVLVLSARFMRRAEPKKQSPAILSESARFVLG